MEGSTSGRTKIGRLCQVFHTGSSSNPIAMNMSPASPVTIFVPCYWAVPLQPQAVVNAQYTHTQTQTHNIHTHTHTHTRTHTGNGKCVSTQTQGAKSRHKSCPGHEQRGGRGKEEEGEGTSKVHSTWSFKRRCGEWQRFNPNEERVVEVAWAQASKLLTPKP